MGDLAEPGQVPITRTARGFAIFGAEPIVTDYGHEVTVHQSSSAEKDALWLTVTGGEGTSFAGERVTAHMTEDQVIELRERLDRWLCYIGSEG